MAAMQIFPASRVHSPAGGSVSRPAGYNPRLAGSAFPASRVHSPAGGSVFPDQPGTFPGWRVSFPTSRVHSPAGGSFSRPAGYIPRLAGTSFPGQPGTSPGWRVIFPASRVHSPAGGDQFPCLQNELNYIYISLGHQPLAFLPPSQESQILHFRTVSCKFLCLEEFQHRQILHTTPPLKSQSTDWLYFDITSKFDFFKGGPNLPNLNFNLKLN